MKTIVIVGLILVTFFISCSRGVEPIDNYSGCIVHKKTHIWRHRRWYFMQRDSVFVEVRVTGFDYKKYEVGDTIK